MRLAEYLFDIATFNIRQSPTFARALGNGFIYSSSWHLKPIAGGMNGTLMFFDLTSQRSTNGAVVSRVSAWTVRQPCSRGTVIGASVEQNSTSWFPVTSPSKISISRFDRLPAALQALVV